MFGFLAPSESTFPAYLQGSFNRLYENKNKDIVHTLDAQGQLSRKTC